MICGGTSTAGVVRCLLVADDEGGFRKHWAGVECIRTTSSRSTFVGRLFDREFMLRCTIEATSVACIVQDLLYRSGVVFHSHLSHSPTDCDCLVLDELFLSL